MIAGVIFDIDGTLLDSLEIWGDVGCRYLKLHDIEPEEGLNDILWPMALEESSAYLKNNYHLSQSENEIKEGILQLIEDFYRNEVQLKSGVREVLESLKEKKIPMTLATTGDRALAQAALKRLDVLTLFQGLFTASDLQTTKNEPLIFQKAAECMGTATEETCVAEDTFYALMTAKKAGFLTLAVYDKVGEKNWKRMEEEAGWNVKKLSELLDMWEIFREGKNKEK